MLGLRRWISAESGATLPKMSIGGMVRSREMGKRRKQLGHHRISTSNRCGTFTVTEKANLANRFFPNREEMTAVTHVPLLRCMHLKSEKLVSLSQDNILTFYIRQRPHYYQLLNRSDLPSANCTVTDITRSSKGEHLAYTTLDAYVYYFHIDRIQEAARWNLFHLLQPIAALRWNVCSSLCFNMDDSSLLVVESGGRISIMGIERPSRYSFQAHERDITAISCSKVNPNIFYTGSSDRFWKVWDSRSNSNNIPVLMTATHSYNVANIDSDSQDMYAVTSSTCGGRIDAWDLRFFENKPCDIYRQQDEVTSHFGEGHIAYLYYIFLETGRKEEADFLWRARFSPQITGHRYVYANSSSGNVYIFDIVTGEVQKLRKQGTILCDSSWHPDNFEIACGTLTGAVVTYYHSEGAE